MASGKLSFISMSEPLLQAARLRAAASERACFIPVPKPEYYSLRQGEEESERGRQREERGRRQGGGSRERGGSAQREAGEAPANAERGEAGEEAVQRPAAQRAAPRLPLPSPLGQGPGAHCPRGRRTAGPEAP